MGLTVKQARIGADMSQREMAKALKISETTYIKYEKQPWTMRAGLALKFCEITHVPIDCLIFLPNDSN